MRGSVGGSGQTIATDFTSLLRLTRVEARLTQESLAEQAGVSVRCVRDIELGRVRHPRPKTVQLLGDALGLSGAALEEFVLRAREDYWAGRGRDANATGELGRRHGVARTWTGPPAQLPPGVAGFVGRQTELRELDGLLVDHATAEEVGICVISGTAGVGKTSLAVHWARRVADQFPDGQLYLNLHGFDTRAAATAPSDAIRALLDALDVPPHRIPVGTTELVGLYRSRLAGRRTLILLDNARDAEQVRPLLPGAPDCLVLVTSRDRMTGLVASEGARSITLDLMAPDEAWEVLNQRLGSRRLAAEAPAVEEIVHRCARLPMALSIVSARAVTHPNVALASLAQQLRGAQHRLDALDGGDPDTDVRAVLLCSYQILGPQAGRLFRLLSLPPGHDISAPAAASLCGLPLSRTRRLLAELTRAHLVTENIAGRYTFHDLLRAYAAELTDAHDAGPEQEAARRRVLDHYLHTADAAARMLEPQRDLVSPAPSQPGVVPERPVDTAAALAWFAAERSALVAAVQAAGDHDLGSHSWQLAWALTTYCQRRGHWHELTAVQMVALRVSLRLGDALGQAYAHRGLARANYRLGRHHEAADHLRHALRLYRGLDHPVGLASSHHGLASVLAALGDNRRGIHHGQRAVTLFRDAGHHGGQAEALNVTAWNEAQSGRPEESLVRGRQALILYQAIGDEHGEASTWDTIGYARHLLGQFEQAVACFEQALRLYEKAGERYARAETLSHLGDARLAVGDTRQARRSWQAALEILTDLDHPGAATVRAKLDGLG